MGIWTPRAKPEVCKFTYTPTTRCLTYLNYVHCMVHCMACMVHCMATRCLTYLNYVHCIVHCMACMVHCMALMVHCMANGIISGALYGFAAGVYGNLDTSLHQRELFMS